jgi:hypothetical protein
MLLAWCSFVGIHVSIIPGKIWLNFPHTFPSLDARVINKSNCSLITPTSELKKCQISRKTLAWLYMFGFHVAVRLSSHLT